MNPTERKPNGQTLEEYTEYHLNGILRDYRLSPPIQQFEQFSRVAKREAFVCPDMKFFRVVVP